MISKIVDTYHVEKKISFYLFKELEARKKNCFDKKLLLVATESFPAFFPMHLTFWI